MSVKIREKPSGSGEWWVFIDHKCKRKAKKIGKDKALAKKIAEQINARLKLGLVGFKDDEQKTSTFGEYADTWINEIVPGSCKHTTVVSYARILKNHVLPTFGKKRIHEITRADVKSFLLSKYKTLARSSVKHCQTVLSCTFSLAMDDEVITANPARDLGNILKKKPQPLLDPLSREELALLLGTFCEHFPEHYVFMLCLSRTGMRLGEAVGLKWTDVDFHNRLITIQRNVTRGRVGTPKNGKYRKVDMSMQLTEELWRVKHHRAGEYGDDMPEWVFINNAGNHIDPDHFRNRVFCKALEKADLRHVRIHDLRHTFASILIQAGEPMAYVKAQLGHSSISVTVDIYSHYLPGGNREAVDRLDDIHFPQQSATYTQPDIKKDTAFREYGT